MKSRLSFQISFPLDLQLHAKKYFLPLLDNYLDGMEDLLSLICRHYEYFISFNRQLSNISSSKFIYRITGQINPPLQMNLDGYINQKVICSLLEKSIGNFFNISDTTTFIDSIHSTSIDLSMDKSFLYTPLRSSVLNDKIEKLKDLESSISQKPELII